MGRVVRVGGSVPALLAGASAAAAQRGTAAAPRPRRAADAAVHAADDAEDGRRRPRLSAPRTYAPALYLYTDLQFVVNYHLISGFFVVDDTEEIFTI